MAGGGTAAVSVSFDGVLEPASPSLQNCINFSSNGRYFSILCDFGTVLICELREVGDSFQVAIVKRLSFGKGELLEGHAWSSDDEIFAVAGCKIYLSKVRSEFLIFHTIPLYYIPKDISLVLSDFSSFSKRYHLAVAGPNGVELYQMEMADNFKIGESSSLHSDLAIALVEFSPDKQYLAVAALDGHFGIWTVSSLDTDQKEFWYVHLKTVRITSMEFSPDSTMVAVTGWEGCWHLYKKTVQDGRLTWTEFSHSTSIDRVSGDLPGCFVSWSPDNRFVRLTQCNDKTFNLSTLDTQTSVTTQLCLDGTPKGTASFRQISGDYSFCVLRSKQCFAVRWPATQPVTPMSTIAASGEGTRLLFQESLEGSVLVELSFRGVVTLQWRKTSEESLALLRKVGTRSQNCRDYASIGAGSKCAELSPEKFKTDDEALEKDNISNEHRNSKDADSGSPEVSAEIPSVGFTGNISRNNCELDNLVTISEKVTTGRVETLQNSEGSDTKYRRMETNGNESRFTSSLCNEVLSLEAPFLNPELFQKSCTGSSTFLPRSGVQLLISTNYVIVAVLPLLAHVYRLQNEEWKTLLFPCPVETCCITQDKYLVLLTTRGDVTIWCLRTMTIMHCSREVLCATESGSRSCIMSGNLFEPQFSIVNLDKAGSGEIIRVSFYPDYGDSKVTVKRSLVCYADLLNHCCTSRLCASIGSLIIFKQSQYPEDCDLTKVNHDCDSWPVKWVVIVPELCINQTFLEEPKCSLEQFITRHHSSLYRLDSLTMATS